MVFRSAAEKTPSDLPFRSATSYELLPFFATMTHGLYCGPIFALKSLLAADKVKLLLNTRCPTVNVASSITSMDWEIVGRIPKACQKSYPKMQRRFRLGATKTGIESTFAASIAIRQSSRVLRNRTSNFRFSSHGIDMQRKIRTMSK
ncbi:uncharacterized protein LOC135713356 [Ochlerotatus camptorhynchus]|uniref:uncharacterized protein LOC135703968 n=1 Tax=Ochlerotatus camptorhynchus TaxID=644619 RepID=UPI0031DE5F36